MSAALLVVPGVVWVSVMLLFVAAPAGDRLPTRRSVLLAVGLASTLAIFSTRSDLAYFAAGTSSWLLAISAWSRAPTGSVVLAVSGTATLAAAVWFFVQGADAVTLVLSLIALALRCGVVPLHAGIAALSRQAPALQARQFATLLVLVFVHLRFADHVPAAHDLAPAMVRLGAATALVFALISLARSSLAGLLQGSTLMHGGLLFAAVGAAGRGHHAAALFACVTMAVAVGGLAFMVLALQARVGAVSLQVAGGRGRAFPRLAAAFAFLGAAGVGMPGTAGFIADDLLLHALWEESVTATVAVALASALLAIATLRAIAAVFFGKQQPSSAPDLLPVERRLTVAFIVLLVGIGLAPQTLTATAAELFEIR